MLKCLTVSVMNARYIRHIAPYCVGVVTRAEHRRNTLLALSGAAVDVMESHGVDAPMELIAGHAGMSRRTLYRWVATRDDVVFIHPRLWLEVFDDAVTKASDRNLASRIRIGTDAVSATIDADPTPVRRAFALALANPELMRGYAQVNQEWIDRLSQEVDPAPTTTAERLRARVIGAALMGAIDAALSEWAIDPDASISELVTASIDHIGEILEER